MAVSTRLSAHLPEALHIDRLRSSARAAAERFRGAPTPTKLVLISAVVLIALTAIVVAAHIGDVRPSPAGGSAPAGAATGSGSYVGSTEGCTAAFWADPAHYAAWEEYTTDQPVDSVLSHARGYESVTLAQALALPDGTPRDVLVREAVASLLNAANDSLAYPFVRYSTGLDGRPAIVPTTNQLLTSGSDDDMASFAAQLAAANGLGCPL
jgi:hypothetical protein